MPTPDVRRDEDIVCAHSNMWERDERTGMNEPLVYQLLCQKHRWVAKFGLDKRWKHISAKPSSKLGIVDSSKTTRLIGSRCKGSNVLSRGVLINHLSHLPRTIPATSPIFIDALRRSRLRLCTIYIERRVMGMVQGLYFRLAISDC